MRYPDETQYIVLYCTARLESLMEAGEIVLNGEMYRICGDRRETMAALIAERGVPPDFEIEAFLRWLCGPKGMLKNTAPEDVDRIVDLTLHWKPNS